MRMSIVTGSTVCTGAELRALHGDQVRRIAHQLAQRMPQGIAVDDLISAGMAAIGDAMSLPDGATAVERSAQTSLHIRRAMLQHARDVETRRRAKQKYQPASSWAESRVCRDGDAPGTDVSPALDVPVNVSQAKNKA